MWCRRHIGKGRTATTTSTRTLGPALNHGTTARTGLTRINRIGQMPINIIGRVTISRTGHDHIRRIGHVRMGLLGEVTHGVLQAVHGNAIHPVLHDVADNSDRLPVFPIGPGLGV